MSHAVLVLARNNLLLTQLTIASVASQTVPTEILVIDNDSTDGTSEWLHDEGISHMTFRPQLGVSEGWNIGLRWLFKARMRTRVLVLNNDIVLPKWFLKNLYNYLLCPFVTGVAVDDDTITARDTCPDPMPLTPNPDFSAFLISLHAWEKIGEFNSRMKFYASDCDYHVRGHRLGVPMMKANVPYYHIGSGTLKGASDIERAEIEAQANADRAVFRSIYGCIPGEPGYDALFSNTVVEDPQGKSL